MYYAKLIDGFPSYAPNPIHYKGYVIGNPPGKILTALGYKPVEYSSMPDFDPKEGHYWAEKWLETDTRIVQSWEQLPIEPIER